MRGSSSAFAAVRADGKALLGARGVFGLTYTPEVCRIMALLAGFSGVVLLFFVTYFWGPGDLSLGLGFEVQWLRAP